MKLPHMFLLIFIILVGHNAAPVWAERQLVDRVIAVVNDEAITQSELDILLRPIYEEYRKEYTGQKLIMVLNDIRRKLMNQLIEDRLVMQEAESKGVDVDDSMVDQKLEEFKSRFENEVTMERALVEQGLTLNDLRDRLKRQAKVTRLHDMEIRAKILVSPAEVEKYYAENAEEFSADERIRTRSITVKKNDEARQKGLLDEEANQKIDSLRQRILAGEDFGKLAKENSEDMHAEEGGLSDWIERGMMIQAIDEVIFSMKPGQISNVIETPMGYHLFRVEERQDGYRKTFVEVRDEIFSILYRKKGETRFRQWMQELKRNAYISIR